MEVSAVYSLDTVVIVAILAGCMVLAIESGYRIGRRKAKSASDTSRSQVNAIQAALLAILGLLLGFNISLSLQRFESRSLNVVEEANSLGTTYLRAQMLPQGQQAAARALLQDYLDVRTRASQISLKFSEERDALVARSDGIQGELWENARVAAKETGGPIVALYIRSLNDTIDSFARRDAALHRHVPVFVLLLLFGTFVMTGIVVGYASGLGDQRSAFATYSLVLLIVLLVFAILDLDRPRRGIIGVSQKSLLELQAVMEITVDLDEQIDGDFDDGETDP